MSTTTTKGITVKINTNFKNSFSPLQFFMLQSTMQTNVGYNMRSIPRVSIPCTITQLLKRFLCQQLWASSDNHHHRLAQDIKCKFGFHIIGLSEQAATKIQM